MAELLTLVSICVLDWVVAGRAMAYTTQLLCVQRGVGDEGRWTDVPPKWHSWYEKKALGTDCFHITGWIRYPALVWFAWLGFGDPIQSFEWVGDWRSWHFYTLVAAPGWWKYPLTALVNALGWGVLKVVHGKSRQWGLLPRWLKQLMGRS